ncbi:hydantoinase/oxoprolinase family protein [Propylenella binzhouense]|uniref:Hydantoinase/oxoprolinase family protein n=1 Tax=Propylenella binzhouense TaxID=2555902 RepID=A0A964WRW1_9HYPH|nr:hydantoinase/oxoprolinase family protein [Propylenella binzhouense]MYZ46221.1 hydantoinase/oxoprolinase family protein [Propylenella binzhouense]
MNWTLGIDVGGTFTDLCAHNPADGRTFYHKRPSTPHNPAEAILAGIAELCARFGLDPGAFSRIAHGTTIATNALIEGKGARVSLITTRGFRDLLEIGRQVRPEIYDLQKDFPPPLVPRERRFEVAERITRGGRVVLALTDEEIVRVVAEVAASKPGAVAVCLLFSHVAPEHERRIGAALAAAMPGVSVSLSCEVRPEFREYERLSTTVLNAYLQPVLDTYLGSLQQGVRELTGDVPLGINQSSGGLISAERARRFPIRTALSGPAAGVAGAAHELRSIDEPHAISLDIGGTSSDVSLIWDYRTRNVSQRWVEGYPVRMPSVDIDAIGAGGGSLAWIDTDGLLKVGPESAGAFPGPACYGRGGTRPTVSDANVVLGRLSSRGLLAGDMPMHPELAAGVIDALAAQIDLPRIWTALGIIDIAVTNMARGIRAISVEKGYDPRKLTLIAYGGAGPLHASAVARALQIPRVVIPPHPGILCAQGLIVADQLEHFVAPLHLPLTEALAPALAKLWVELSEQARQWFVSQDVSPASRRSGATLDMRYAGQNFEITVPWDPELPFDAVAMREAFSLVHRRIYGFDNANAQIEVTSAQLAASGRHTDRAEFTPAAVSSGFAGPPQPVDHREVWFQREAPHRAAVYRRDDIGPGQEIAGPAIVEQLDTTTVLFPGDRARSSSTSTLVIEIDP